jgi:hypothetical protein
MTPQQRYKATVKAGGGRIVELRLSPDALAKLDRLQSHHGKNRRALIEVLIAQAAKLLQ